jgi:outer membrane protein
LNKKIATLLVALMAALPIAQAVAAEMKIGYVNTQRIFRDAPAAQKAAKKIEAEFSKRDQDLQRMAKQLQSMQEGLEKNSVTMSESDRRNKERELNDLSRDFRQNEENAAIIEKANKAIKQIAEADKFDLIVQDVVWVSPKLDITEKVIKSLSEAK